MNEKDQIKDIINIKDYIGRDVELNHSNMGKCPFHKDDNPSFSVNEDEQYFKCFGCGEKGDIFTYVMKSKGCDFKEALEILAEKAGVELKQFKSRDYVKKRKESDKRKQLLEFARGEFEQLEGSNKYKKYATERHMAQSKDIGYIPSEDVLKEKLGSKYTDYVNTHTFKKHKLIIAYRDKRGNIQGFISTCTKEDRSENVGKYLYSKGLKVSKLLFGLHEVDYNPQELIIVEGFVDVLHARQKGVSNIVAIGSATPTEEQISLLLDREPEQYLLGLDMDGAGVKGNIKLIKLLVEANPYKDIFVLDYNDCNDFDERLTKGAKPEEVLKGVNVWYKYYIDKLLEVIGVGSIDDMEGLTDIAKGRVRKEMFRVSELIQSETQLTDYIQHTDKALQSIGATEEAFKKESMRRQEEKRQEEHEQKVQELINKSYSSKDKPKECLEVMQEGLQEIEDKQVLHKVNTYLEPVNLEECVYTYLEEPKGLDSGYMIGNESERKSLMIPLGAITTIGGRTGHGKTTLLMNLAINLLDKVQDDETVHYFTYEEAKAEILIKLITIYVAKEDSTVDREGIRRALRDDTVDTGVAKHIAEFKEKYLETGKLKVHYMHLPVDDLTDVITGVKEHDNAKVVLIDYLQKIPNPEGAKNAGTRQLELQRTLSTLLDATVETGMAVITAAQFNRAVKSLKDLNLAGFREAGDIEQDTHLALGIWNATAELNSLSEADENFKKIEAESFDLGGRLYVRVMKNRAGQVGTEMDLKFTGNNGLIKQ